MKMNDKDLGLSLARKVHATREAARQEFLGNAAR